MTWDFANIIRKAPGSDLWPITWAADDHLYTSWGDGGGFGGTNKDGRVSLGFARIEGSPNDFVGTNVWGGKDGEKLATFDGKASGMLSVNGVLYAWINMQNGNPPDFKLAWSSDLSRTWHLASWRFPGVYGAFFARAFLNFGKDYTGARDGFVYIYGNTYGNWDHAYLARVSRDHIKTLDAYEFFKGLDMSGNATWTSDMTQRQPVFTDLNGAGITVVYNNGINRYIAASSRDGQIGKLALYEALEPWGPWTTVAYYDNWGDLGENIALFYYFPTKWMSADGKTMWMVFSSTGELDSFNLVKATLTLRTPKQTTARVSPIGLKMQ